MFEISNITCFRDVGLESSYKTVGIHKEQCVLKNIMRKEHAAPTKKKKNNHPEEWI
jgi:hypothetical protein